MGFTKRVFPRSATKPHDCNHTNDLESIHPQTNTDSTPTKTNDRNESEETKKSLEDTIKVVTKRTEITFDFHRLNVLVLRAVMRDTFLVGRKVGTFTMSEAKIHATLGVDIRVEGSLGGLQVIDLTPEGVAHQRILSIGKDPLTEPSNVPPRKDLLSSLTQEVYSSMTGQYHKTDFTVEDQQALSFFVSRTLSASVAIRIRMASVWYTHCARFMQELNWCATEFKHYLK